MANKKLYPDGMVLVHMYVAKSMQADLELAAKAYPEMNFSRLMRKIISEWLKENSPQGESTLKGE
jgi:hypothetical protein